MVKSKGDVHCTSLLISRKSAIIGGVEADCVVVNGKVEGPICGSEVVLKSHADVVATFTASTSHRTGAYFDGRSICSPASNLRKAPEKLTERLGKATEL